MKMKTKTLLKLLVVLAVSASVGDAVAQSDVALATRKSELQALSSNLKIRDQPVR